MTDIKWEDPPAIDKSGRGRYDDLAAALRENPGRWALVGDDLAASTTTAINTGRLRAFMPPGAFQSRSQTHKDDPRRRRIWARYVGGAA